SRYSRRRCGHPRLHSSDGSHQVSDRIRRGFTHRSAADLRCEGYELSYCRGEKRSRLQCVRRRKHSRSGNFNDRLNWRRRKEPTWVLSKDFNAGNAGRNIPRSRCTCVKPASVHWKLSTTTKAFKKP